MTEDEFIEELVRRLDLQLDGCKLGTHKSVRYALFIDESGHVEIDRSAGEPKRGGGTGFEQDILLYQTTQAADTGIVPRVIAEVKFEDVNTHDPIIYSEKARRIRIVYPYVRYGLILGGMATIAPRVLRLGEGFDFIVAVPYPLADDSLRELRDLFADELRASRALSEIARSKRGQVTLFRRRVIVEQHQRDA